MIVPKAGTVAVIPARGGSKEIKGKNLVDFAGRPLVSWSIEAVASSGQQMRALVTTDSVEIAQVAQASGAEVVVRPVSLARDTSPTEPALLHALDFIEASDDDVMVLLQPTSPIRLAGTLDAALELFHVSGCDSLVGVVEESPFFWGGPLNDAHAKYDIWKRPRRQDLAAENMRFRETGSIYICSVGGLRRHQNRLHGRVTLMVMDPLEGIDIDTQYDLQAARAVAETLGMGDES